MQLNKPNPRRSEGNVLIGGYDRIVLAHGGGGRLMHELIEDVLLEAYGDRLLADGPDSTPINIESSRLSISTDSFVVRPLFFPGGDIGKLSVCGTINDLAMSGARPLFLTVGLILEEGLMLSDLSVIATSIGDAARADGVRVVAGDTKVVEKGNGDGIYINTAGLGVRDAERAVAPAEVLSGDAVILSGDIGRHGIAVMAARENLPVDPQIESDCASLWPSVSKLIDAGIEIHCMRDLTRGGLGAAVVEIASVSGKHVELVASRIPVAPQVRGACEILGFDPMFVANEGRFVAFVPQKCADEAVAILEQIDADIKPARIGVVSDDSASGVSLESEMGVRRAVHMPSGEQLPRIC